MVTLTMAEKHTTATRSPNNDCVIGCARFTDEDGEGEEISRVHRMPGPQCVVPGDTAQCVCDDRPFG